MNITHCSTYEKQTHLPFANLGPEVQAILCLFCLDIEAAKVAQTTAINRPVLNRLFDRPRQHIAWRCGCANPFVEGAVELGQIRICWKRSNFLRWDTGLGSWCFSTLPPR